MCGRRGAIGRHGMTDTGTEEEDAVTLTSPDGEQHHFANMAEADQFLDTLDWGTDEVECSKPTSPSESSPRLPGQSRSVGGCKQCCVDSLTWSNASVVNWFI